MDDLVDCAGYEGLYAVTSDGRIWAYPKVSRRVGRWLKQREGRFGYYYVGFCKSGIVKTVKTHRLVAAAFLGASPFEGAQVNHIDGVKSNNCVSNLEWCTAKENKQHAWDTGITKHAPSQTLASARNITAHNVSLRKLNADQTANVLEGLKSGISMESLARAHGVSGSVIKRIKKENPNV